MEIKFIKGIVIITRGRWTKKYFDKKKIKKKVIFDSETDKPYLFFFIFLILYMNPKEELFLLLILTRL